MKKQDDYLRFFKFVLTKIYQISNIKLNIISIIFFGVKIPLSELNTLKSNARMKMDKGVIKKTTSNCSLVLISGRIIGNT